MIAFISQELGDKVTHLVWEYDGVGLNESALAGRATFLTDTEDYIYKETQYRMRIATKKEQPLHVLLKSRGTRSAHATTLSVDQLASFCTKGNCIQAAVVMARGCAKPPLPTPEAGVRKYLEVATHLSFN